MVVVGDAAGKVGVVKPTGPVDFVVSVSNDVEDVVDNTVDFVVSVSNDVEDVVDNTVDFFPGVDNKNMYDVCSVDGENV